MNKNVSLAIEKAVGTISQKHQNDQKNNKQYLEIYSDVTKPLLTEYSFFKEESGSPINN